MPSKLFDQAYRCVLYNCMILFEEYCEIFYLHIMKIKCWTLQNLLPSNHDDPKKYTEGQEVVARIGIISLNFGYICYLY